MRHLTPIIDPDYTENSVRYDYSLTDGRLSSISNPQLSNVSFAYGYETGSSLVKTVTGPAHTVTNTYEPNRDILDVKENKAGTSVVSRYDYTVNAIGQRSNVAQTGTAFAAARSTAWAYDPLGQVTRADSTISGLDRAYQFDLIGNRLKTADSLTLPVANNYTPNALNQYSSITNPQSAILNPLHDADGNMTSGPLPANVNANSTLVWDGENRLIQATVGTTGSVVRYSYDSQSRRIAETIGTTTKLTVYDGWNPIAEYAIQNSTFTIQNSYLWGIDLSGTMQGAGGVGGLLMTSLITNNSITSNYFPTYDGNGNVSEYLNESGEVSAHYEYDPFGKTTVATGPKAQDFSHRFSTKPLDATTGLYYYGYRFYDPNTGRWPSRDPIEEMGGVNLYGFVGNDGVNKWDLLGLADIKITVNRVKSNGVETLGKFVAEATKASLKECCKSVTGETAELPPAGVAVPASRGFPDRHNKPMKEGTYPLQINDPSKTGTQQFTNGQNAGRTGTVNSPLLPLPAREGWTDKDYNRNFNVPGTQICIHYGHDADWSDLCIILGRDGKVDPKNTNNRSYPGAPAGTQPMTTFSPNSSSKVMIDVLDLYDCMKDKLGRKPTMSLTIQSNN
jgi:RHS repeat-associated protein